MPCASSIPINLFMYQHIVHIHFYIPIRSVWCIHSAVRGRRSSTPPRLSGQCTPFRVCLCCCLRPCKYQNVIRTISATITLGMYFASQACFIICFIASWFTIPGYEWRRMINERPMFWSFCSVTPPLNNIYELFKYFVLVITNSNN